MDALDLFDALDAQHERMAVREQRTMRRFPARVRVIVANHVKMYVYRTAVLVEVQS